MTTARLPAWGLPTLVAISSCLYIASKNIGDVEVLDIFFTSLLSICLALPVYLATSFWHWSNSLRSIVTSLWLLLFFYFIPLLYVLSEIFSLKIGWQSTAAIAGSLCGLGMIATYCMLKNTKKVEELNTPLLVMAIMFNLISVYNFAYASFLIGNEVSEYTAPQIQSVKSKTEDYAPKYDVHHIIVDGYPSNDVLREFYGFDNSAFLEELKKRGFIVYPKARANYMFTQYALAALFNLNYLKIARDENGDLRLPEYGESVDLIQNNVTVKAVKSAGFYFLLNTSHFFKGTHKMKGADKKLSSSFLLSNLMDAVLSNTPISRLDAVLAYPHYRNGKERLESIGELDLASDATWSVSHIPFPHEPYVISAKGEFTIPNINYQSAGVLSKTAFIAQLQYVNRGIIKGIDKIEGNSKRPFMVFLHADHGSISTYDSKLLRLASTGQTLSFQQKQKLSDFSRERSGILFAVRSIDGIPQPWDQEGVVSPISGMRWLVGNAIGTDFPELPDEWHLSGDLGNNKLITGYETP